jgi:large subunit ribosomal protein L21
MYAVVNTGGRQLVVAEGEVITIDLRNAEVGSTIELGKVLLVKNGEKVVVGKPEVSGAKVTAEVLGHGRAKKIRIFKSKRRKNYKRTQGHRQDFTRVKVASISV